MMLYKLVSGSDRQRFSHIVISMTDKGTLGGKMKALGVPVYTLDMKRSIPSLAAMLRLSRVIRTIQPDVIQGWMYHGNLLSLIASKLTNRRVSVMWNIRQSLYSLSYEKRLTRLIIKCGALMSGQVTRILYNSATSSKHHKAFGYRDDKSIVIPNGFDINSFAPSAEGSRTIRASLGVSADTLLICLIGRYHPMKDHSTFLKAASLLLAKNIEAQFVLAGKGIYAHNVPLQAEIEKLGITKRTHLLGERSDIPQLMAAVDIAVSSSYNEGFPNVVGEAMSCAIPCVVTDVGDSAMIVGDSGIVVPPRDPKALSDALYDLASMGSEQRRYLGQKARNRICENFSLESVVKRYEALFEQLV
ncbi:MAG TPA: glycosyltransferase [Nitrospirota bacterium]|nr:glycosyltransferase [Nitrospirota bacterium]